MQEDSRDLQCQCSTRVQEGIRYAPPWLEGTGQRCPNAVSAASSGIQLKAEQRLHSPAHRRRRDSERQETWRLEHQQREPAQRLRARLRRWNLQRRVLSMPLQSSTRDRSGSASEARASANMPVAQGCGCEAAITGMGRKPARWSRLAALSLHALQSKPQRLRSA